MNKVYIDTYTYSVKPQNVVTTKGKPLEIIMGVSTDKYSDEEHYQQYVNFINSLLIHDKIVVRQYALEFLIVLFGVESIISLFKNKRLEVFDNTNKHPVLLPDGKFYKLRSIENYDTGNLQTTDTLEKRLLYKYQDKKKQIDELMQLIESNSIFVDLEKVAKESSIEIESDLNNAEFRKQFLIDSTSHNEIKPPDIYKILRLDYINRTLLYSFNSGSINTVAESSTEKILTLKYNSFISNETNPDSISLFQKILTDKQIPDLINLYNHRVLTFNDILEISENINGKKFRDWYFSTNYNKDEVYFGLLKSVNSKSTSLIKATLKWFIPNAISLINPLLGKPTSIITSPLINKLIKEWHPNLFLDDVLKKTIDENIKGKSFEFSHSKVGRNDKCLCGSGIKYKFCHGKNK